MVVSNDDIAAKNYSFSAGQYVDVKIEYTDMTPEQFAAKMKGFTENLNNLFEQSRELEVQIKMQMAEISNMKFNYLKIKDVCDFVGGSQPPKSQFIYDLNLDMSG